MNTHKDHWENIFATKTDDQKSWYEAVPRSSLGLIKELGISKNDAIIDIGGGDSHLVDALVSEGYNNVSVLDISENALNNAKRRMGSRVGNVNWIVSDVLNFQAANLYDLWHDRAAFHFITDEASIKTYLEKAFSMLNKGGHFILATFSEQGPEKCSGLPVSRYSEKNIAQLLDPYFEKVKCFEEIHTTPFKAFQSFTYCGFSKRRA